MEKVALGKILRAWGVKGELIIFPLTDDLKSFNQVQEVFISDSEGKEVIHKIERSRIFRGKILLQLEGIESREKADTLKGKYIEINKEDVPLLSEGRYYLYDLVGCKVENQEGKSLGEIKEVLLFPANDILVVRKGSKEYYIPFIKNVVKKIDLQAKLVSIELLSGLLE